MPPAVPRDGHRLATSSHRLNPLKYLRLRRDCSRRNSATRSCGCPAVSAAQRDGVSRTTRSVSAGRRFKRLTEETPRPVELIQKARGRKSDAYESALDAITARDAKAMR